MLTTSGKMKKKCFFGSCKKKNVQHRMLNIYLNMYLLEKKREIEYILMMTKLSIIVPAYNEERGLRQAVNSLYSFLTDNKMALDSEILIFNDCSLDKTGEIADRLVKDMNIVKVFHNRKNMGLGFNFREGARQSKGEYVTWFPGDNENLPQSFIDTVSRIGEADIIIPYTDNMEVRSFLRRLVSRVYTDMNNFDCIYSIK